MISNNRVQSTRSRFHQRIQSTSLIASTKTRTKTKTTNALKLFSSCSRWNTLSHYNHLYHHPLEGSSHEVQESLPKQSTTRWLNLKQKLLSFEWRNQSQTRRHSANDLRASRGKRKSSTSAVLDDENQEQPHVRLTDQLKSNNNESMTEEDSARLGTSTTTTEINNNDEVPAAAATFEDLTLVGKIVAGTTEATLVIIFDYISGFCTGYGFGSLWGFPGLILGRSAAEQSISTAASTRWTQLLKQRLGIWHARNARWGGTWGSVSAVVGGCGVAARVIRNGKDDEWTALISSMAMGAFWFRQDGAFAMIKGALIYGGIMYMFGGKQKEGVPMQDNDDDDDEEPLAYIDY